MYHDFQKSARLAVLTGRILGASDTPETGEQAEALGRAMLCMMTDDDRLEAQCLATELLELSDDARHRFNATRLRLRFDTITTHVGSDVACVAALLAGFFITNLGEEIKPYDWRDYADLCMGDAGVGVVAIPDDYSWTGRQFVTDDG